MSLAGVNQDRRKMSAALALVRVVHESESGCVTTHEKPIATSLPLISDEGVVEEYF